MKPFSTLADVICHIEKNYSNPKALNYQVQGGWEHVSSKDFTEAVKYIALGLRSLGIKKGDMIGLLSESSPQWSIADFAIMMAGGVSVPLFSSISNENFNFEVIQTNIKYIFVAGHEQWEMISHYKNKFDVVISMRNEEEYHPSLSFDDVILKGKALDAREPDLYNKLLSSIKPDDLASIVYTSGSTGFPKGVMLNHYNLAGLLHIDPFEWDNTKDIYLSLLPLAHIYSRVINFATIAWGVGVYYLSDLSTMSAVCRELKPTFAIVVPRIFEKIYSKLLYNLEHANFLKRAIGKWAYRLANNPSDRWYRKIQNAIADKLVFSKIREALGGNFRFIVSGGASLDPDLQSFFVNIGIPLYQGWGLTEAATVCCCPMGKIKPGTVGVPFEKMQIKIDEDEEILVKGPLVMQGYYKNEEATRQTLTCDGWMRTGDKGIIDPEGNLIIKGRLKELYKTSTGEYIAPVPIEQELCKVPFVDMAMVVGDGKKFASCLLFPDFEVIKVLKKSFKMETLSDEEFLNSKPLVEEVNRHLSRINKHLNHWEEVHAFRFIPIIPSILGGELTPTLKIRRDVILEKYRDLINRIYVEEAA